jgi:hypothetical protein
VDIPIDGVSGFALDTDPIREGADLDVSGYRLVCLIHRVRTEVEDASPHDGLVFLWRSCCAIVGCEFGQICASDHILKAASDVRIASGRKNALMQRSLGGDASCTTLDSWSRRF